MLYKAIICSCRTGWRDPNSQTTCLLKTLYSTEKKCTKLRNFNASAIRALPTTTHATLPALIARELEIVRGGLSGDWVTLIAAHNSNTSTIIYKNKASDCFMNQESKLDCISVLIHGWQKFYFYATKNMNVFVKNSSEVISWYCAPAKRFKFYFFKNNWNCKF